ncbi:hypothetical protein Vadar_032167 [Vaccinium darrowii]|uniref:Uncharacterized protein n=1 Tax=Vaccinium darrowii TaxID=229202 RepID=A0ACB7Y4T9_9ERIC|nr:hypothetical protein Vadar_032167 [Vaccinium darrowii]
MDLLDKFGEVHIQQISSGQNAHANSLACLGSTIKTEYRRTVVVDYLSEPIIGRAIELIMETELGLSWMDPIVAYLRDGTLPEDKKEAHKIKTKSIHFWLSPEGKRKFLLIGTGYFTKWIEGEALAKITEAMVEKSVWSKIITRFGVSYSIISDNGSQFGKKFKAFCAQYGIRNYYSTPAYPQSNGQAEASNKTILKSLKKRLESKKEKWSDELSAVLWAYKTTHR